MTSPTRSRSAKSRSHRRLLFLAPASSAWQHSRGVATGRRARLIRRMADDFPPPEYYEALRRDERTVTSLVIDPDQRVVTVTLGGAIPGTTRTTFTADISEHPELLQVTLGDEIS